MYSLICLRVCYKNFPIETKMLYQAFNSIEHHSQKASLLALKTYRLPGQQHMRTGNHLHLKYLVYVTLHDIKYGNGNM